MWLFVLQPLDLFKFLRSSTESPSVRRSSELARARLSSVCVQVFSSNGEDVREGSRGRCPGFGGAVLRFRRGVLQQETALLCSQSRDEPVRSQVSLTDGTTLPSNQRFSGRKKKSEKGDRKKLIYLSFMIIFFTAELLAWIVSRIGSLSSVKHKSDHLCQRTNSHSNIM